MVGAGAVRLALQSLAVESLECAGLPSLAKLRRESFA